MNCEQFNAKVRLGSQVRFWREPGKLGEPVVGITASVAMNVREGVNVVKIKGEPKAIPIDQVEA